MTFPAQTDPITAMDRGLSKRERSRLMPDLRACGSIRGLSAPVPPKILGNR
jgi:hypothetical protein